MNYNLCTLLLTVAITVACARTVLEPDQGLPTLSTEWLQQHSTPPTTALPLIVHLTHTPQQVALLEKNFWSVSDPDDALHYGNHLTQNQVTALVAHDSGKLQHVVGWLSSSGAQHIKVNAHQDSIHFVATANQVATLFHTELYAYTHVTRKITLHRSKQHYSVPDEFASSIALVSGLLRLPNLDRLGGTAEELRVQPNPPQPSNNDTPWPSDCKGCSEKVTPGVLALRYSFPTPTTSDPPATLAISEFQGQVWDQSDLDHFATACRASVNFNVTVNHENGTVSPGKTCKIPILGTQFCGEALLDIEYAKAVAGPAVSLTDMYQASFNLLTWSTNVENIDDANLIGVHSISYGNDEKQQSSTAYMTSFNSAAMKIGVRGVSILFASGDQGVCGRSGCGFGKSVRFHPDFPSGSPYVTSVGGTDFATRSVIGEEKAWVSGGGGFSDTFPIPSYQQAAVAKYKSSADAKLPPQSMWNNTGRGYPDVSALAGQQNAYCISAGSLLLGIYGTSAATPVTAAIFARLNGVRVKNGGKKLGFLNPWIYKNGELVRCWWLLLLLLMCGGGGGVDGVEF